MSSIYALEREQFIPRPRTEVFRFFEDAGNLQQITPPWLHFRIQTPLPLEMKPGALLEYRLRLYGLPLFWRTRIECYEPPVRFVDKQLRGPYRLWEHTHEFTETPDGTLMRDIVRYQLPFGPLGTLTHALTVQHLLCRIFDFRRDVIAKEFGGELEREVPTMPEMVDAH
jgi:ligand-binding SRPBCC domain-containing protein